MWKPMLAPNDKVSLEEINYPIFASTKLDGYRCIFYKGQIVTRSLKSVQNKQLKEKFEILRKYSEENNLIIDGEIYSNEITFQELNKFFMSEDLQSERSIKRYGKALIIPDHVKFYAFDCISEDNLLTSFQQRLRNLDINMLSFKNIVEVVKHEQVNSKEEISNLFERVLEQGYEGLILRDINGKYKCGRGTIKEGLIYKVKPFVTFDSKIIGVVQATEVDPNAEKKINELGRSVTSKKKDDRILINKASAFEVEYNDLCDKCLARGKTGIIIKSENNCLDCGGITHKLKVVLAMTDKEKEEVWANREVYIGKVIEYKGMLVGAKDVPRHPVMIRFREDKQ